MIKNFGKILELLGDRLEVCVSVSTHAPISAHSLSTFWFELLISSRLVVQFQ